MKDIQGIQKFLDKIEEAADDFEESLVVEHATDERWMFIRASIKLLGLSVINSAQVESEV